VSRRKELEEDAALSPRLIALHEDPQIQNVCASTTMTSQPYLTPGERHSARTKDNRDGLDNICPDFKCHGGDSNGPSFRLQNDREA
jgi:hypothetical protein